jgi:hypothetical protein
MSSLPPQADHGTAANGKGPSPRRELRSILEEAEAGIAEALENVVAGQPFGAMVAFATENAMALGRIMRESADLAVSNLRIAGRSDVVRLERQLGRTEDKLEVLLQELEGLRGELANANRP